MLGGCRSLGMLWWLYILGGGCVYGAVVPFWFIGAKSIELKWGLPTALADGLILLPEGCIVIIAPLLGWMCDSWRLLLRTRLVLQACAQLLIGGSLYALATPPTDVLPSPIPVVLVLGVSYAVAQSLIWAAFGLVAPEPLINVCFGLLGAALNFFPAVVPPTLFTGDGPHDLQVLVVVSGVGTAALLAAAALAARGCA